MTGSRVSLVTVLHESAPTVVRCLRSVPGDVEVIVVDNASTDDGAALARHIRPDATILRAANDGFGAGCNRGALAASGDVLLFLNPDAWLLADTVAALVERLEAEPRAIVAPALLDDAGALRANLRRSSRPWHEIAELLPAASRWLPERARRDVPARDARYRHGGTADYLQGACLAMRRDAYLSLGGFDARYFLYGEEEDLCARVVAAGGRCHYEPGARVAHQAQASARQVPLFSAAHMYRSKAILYRRRHGPVRGRAAITLIAAGALLQLGLALPRLARGRSAQGLPWVGAVLRGLVDGARAPLSAVLIEDGT